MEENDAGNEECIESPKDGKQVMKSYKEFREALGKGKGKREAGKISTLIKKLIGGRQVVVDGPNPQGVFTFFSFSDDPKPVLNRVVGVWDTRKNTFKSTIKVVHKFINDHLSVL